MGATLDGNRLKSISITGKTLEADLVESCTKATFGASTSQVTEMSLTFLDTMDLEIFRSGLLASGASVAYGGWSMITRSMSLKSGSAGPELTVKCPSIFVERLRDQTGGYSWGDRDVTSWARDMAHAVGLKPVVQPGLGTRTIVRADTEGDDKESSWEVLASVAKAVGCWLFEYGNTMVMAKPSWLVANDWGGRYWPFYWNNWADYSDGLQGLPGYDLDPNGNPAERLQIRLVSPDADEIRPGDTVDLGGNVAGMMGKWIVVSVSFPMTVDGVVTADCVRPIDPVIPPENTTASTGTAGAATKATPKPAAAGGGGAAASGVAGAVTRFFNKYNGVAIDHDGAYGAQCVDLTMRYAREVFGVQINGNGKEWFANGPRSGAFRQVGAGAAPQVGDIACWGPSMGGGWGHVAIVLGDAGGAISCMSQNPGPARKMNITKAGLQGYLRPTKAV